MTLPEPITAPTVVMNQAHEWTTTAATVTSMPVPMLLARYIWAHPNLTGSQAAVLLDIALHTGTKSSTGLACAAPLSVDGIAARTHIPSAKRVLKELETLGEIVKVSEHTTGGRPAGGKGLANTLVMLLPHRDAMGIDLTPGAKVIDMPNRDETPAETEPVSVDLTIPAASLATIREAYLTGWRETHTGQAPTDFKPERFDNGIRTVLGNAWTNGDPAKLTELVTLASATAADTGRDVTVGPGMVGTKIANALDTLAVRPGVRQARGRGPRTNDTTPDFGLEVASDFGLEHAPQPA